MDADLHEEFQDSLHDLQRYLLDQIPPLTASESIETLITQPPELMMQLIHAWALEQSTVQAAAMSDFLFHAIKKIYQVGTLKLIEPAVLDPYLNRLIPLAIAACPPAERDTFRTHVAALPKSRVLKTAAVQVKLEVPGESAQAPAAQVPRPEGTAPEQGIIGRSARRLSLVIDRLAEMMPGRAQAAQQAAPSPRTATIPGGVPLSVAQEPVAQLVTMAATSATTEQELEKFIETLRPYTAGAQAGNLFQILAPSVPGWEVVAPPDAVVKPAAPVEAMHKIITLTKGSLESSRRFRELLMAAVEQFNSGSLGAALSMLELAEIVITEKKLDPASVERIRGEAVEAISSEQLRKYTENKTKHVALRKVLACFPTLTTLGLLRQLRGEERPDRRRSLLALLEAYGPEAWDAAVAELEVELSRLPAEIDTYYLRNLIYLLHRAPREGEAGSEKVLELLAKASSRGQNIYVIREAVIPISFIKSEAAVKVLTTRLAEFEALLSRSDISLYSIDDMQKLLDRIVTALSRIGTPASLQTIARHGLKPHPNFGDTRSRLATLAQHDMSFDERIVKQLVEMIRQDLPTKFLGRYVPQRAEPPVKLIEAISGTRSKLVDELLTEIRAKYPDHETGRAAATALAMRTQGTAVQETPAATLAGDLQFFELPTLLQSLTGADATGILTLTSKQTGQPAGKVLLVHGKFVDAQVAHLRGVDAFYQLMERPVVGAFAFVPQPAETVKSKNPRLEIVPMLFEGMRRHDELNQATVLVPDDLVVRTTEKKPTPDPEEHDPVLFEQVWAAVTQGERMADWEAKIQTDAYRIRRLVAHWMEQGSLQRR